MEHNIGEKIIEKIREGKIQMKSKSYFMLRTILFSLTAIVILLFAVYLLSFIIFNLRISGIFFLPQFGVMGLGAFFRSLPWLLIIISFGTIVLLEFFAERIEFVYKRPTLYSLLAIILVTFTASFALGFSPFHTNLFHTAREGHLPLVGAFYQGASPSFHDFHHGIVSEVTDSGFTIMTPNGETLAVQADNDIKNQVKEGDPVLIMGEQSDHTVKATRIKKINEDDSFFPPHKKKLRPLLPFLFKKGRTFN